MSSVGCAFDTDKSSQVYHEPGEVIRLGLW